MNDRYDVIVVGGGVIGAAIFNRLSQDKRNKKILLVEKSRFGLGSTGWSGGIVRCYHPDPMLSDMACEGNEYYQNFELHTGVDCAFTKDGFLYFIPNEQESYAQDEVKRLSNRTEIFWFNNTDAKLQFPMVNWDGLAGAVFEPTAGYMDTVSVTQAWIKSAQKNGGIALEGVAFNHLLETNSAVTGINTNCGTFYAKKVVMCVGAWTQFLGRAAQVDAPECVYSKAIQLNVFSSTQGFGQHPAYIDPHYGLYGRAQSGKTIYLGCPVPEWNINPDLASIPSHQHIQLSQDIAGKRFLWAKNVAPQGGFRRFDAYTDDEKGVVSSSSSIEGLFWATGFSGGGFKIAPAVASKIQQIINS